MLAVCVVYGADVWSGLGDRQFATIVHNDSGAVFYVLCIVFTTLMGCLQVVQLLQVKQLWVIAKATERKAQLTS